MNALQRYVVSTKWRGRTQTKTWDPREPMLLARGAQGPLWVLETTPKGQVRVRSLSLAEGQVGNAHSQVLSNDQVRRGVQVKFKKKELDEIELEIHAIERLHPEFYRKKQEKGGDLSRGFEVYFCMLDWRAQVFRYRKSCKAVLHGEEIFSVESDGKNVKIRPSRPGVVLDVNGAIQNLDSLLEIEISGAEFFKSTIRFGYTSWYFGPIPESKKEAIFETPAFEQDFQDFKRWAGLSVLSLLLFLGGGYLWPKPKQEEVVPAQIVKVLIKKKETVGKKQELPGPKTEDKEKPLAMSEQTQEQPKPNELIVPKGGQTGKKLDNKQVKRIAKVQSLYTGIMRGGLMKLLQNTQIMDTSRLGAAAVGKNKGDLKNLSSALANLNVDVNAGGVADAKVQGFGGDSNAGVRGPATAGYANGVKGVMSGSGGSNISLGTNDAEVEEGLTKEEVGKVIHEHMKEVRYCYDSSMVRSTRVDGKVTLAFSISGQGRITRVSSVKDGTTIADPALGDCIMRRLRTWQFPNPKGGVNVDVSYPFIFKTLGGR